MAASRDHLRALVESLPDDMLPEAISLLTHLEDDEPLSDQERANIEDGLADIREGRMMPLEDYERQRGL
jgi:predicted transcriptional regulator